MSTPRAPDPTEAEVLRETLDALEMPPRGLRRWFADDRAFCDKHGGRRVYGELLSLLDACDAALDAKLGAEGEGR
ncbi:MAG: hypothetical protein U0359_41535 [Byssovorax sp.]